MTPKPPLRGRPRRVADKRSGFRVEFRLTDEEREALRLVAIENGRPLSDVIREAVNEYVSDYSERRPLSR